MHVCRADRNALYPFGRRVLEYYNVLGDQFTGQKWSHDIHHNEIRTCSITR